MVHQQYLIKSKNTKIRYSHLQWGYLFVFRNFITHQTIIIFLIKNLVFLNKLDKLFKGKELESIYTNKIDNIQIVD